MLQTDKDIVLVKSTHLLTLRDNGTDEVLKEYDFKVFGKFTHLTLCDKGTGEVLKECDFKDEQSSMEWYVYYYDQNNKQLFRWNIFDHIEFTENLKILRSKRYILDKFSSELQHIARYYFWSKYEYEIFIEPLNSDKSAKIDVFDQLMLNWGAFAQYCYDYER